MSVHIPIPEDRPVRVRIAPSPTGDPHVGTAYVALFNRVFADKHDGRFVLRIEDTDRERSSQIREDAIMRSLRWLGLEWDEGPDVGGDYGPYRQSERTEIYQRYAQELVERDEAYYDFATPEELEAMRRERKAQGLPPRYDRRYRDLDPEEVQRRLDEGQPYTIRLKMPLDGETVVRDGLRGVVRFNNDEIDDQVLLKSDGYPTYHLANVVDDRLMGITHVIRAEEWIPSTPKHIRLYEAFGWEQPVFIHLPLLRNSDKSKISKRRNPVSLEYYQQVGILPEALVNFLGRMGWSMPDEREKFSLQEMIREFTFDRMSLGGPVFNLDKLDWLNGLYLRELDDAALVERLQGWLLGTAYLHRLAPLVRDRIKRLEDFVPLTEFFFSGDFEPTVEQLVPKKRDQKQAYRATKTVTEALEDLEDWQHERIEELMRRQCEILEWSPRELFMMTRILVTGRKATPPLFETMEAIGKARCQARLREGMRVLRP